MMRFLPTNEALWSEKLMFLKGEDYANKIHNWGERGCIFFNCCVGDLQMGELPDIERLIKAELTDSSGGGRRGRRGRVGKKGSKLKQNPIPNMKM